MKKNLFILAIILIALTLTTTLNAQVTIGSATTLLRAIATTMAR